MSWKTEVLVDGKWSTNAVVLATKEEAEEAGKELLSRWFLPVDSRAVESTDQVNYKFNFDMYKLERMES
jgi:hypothetical protein